MSLTDAHRAIGADLRRQRGLAALLGSFSDRRIDVLVIKGAALAHLVYDQPHARPRCDVDLLIRKEALESADEVLLRAGYRRQLEPASLVATGQRHYDPPARSADPVDLHWRVVNPLVFADLLPFDAAWSRSIRLPALGPAARTLCMADALLLACVHRAAHHSGDDDPKWLKDIDGLVRRLAADDYDAFLEAAARTGTRAICAHGLGEARQQLQTPCAPLLARLNDVSSEPETSAAFVERRLALAEIVASDLRHARWRDGIQILREHLFPSVAYMRGRYPSWPAILLPFAYVVRIGWGAPAWFRR